MDEERRNLEAVMLVIYKKEEKEGERGRGRRGRGERREGEGEGKKWEKGDTKRTS